MKKPTIQVVLLEDDDDDAYLIRKSLHDDNRQNYIVHHFSTLSEYLAEQPTLKADVLLLDLNLAESKGLNTLRAINLRTPSYPVIILSNHSDLEFGQESIHIGADDYLCKSELEPNTLSRSIRYAMERFKLISQLEKRAFTDELTGLPNRAQLLEQLQQNIAAAKRHNSQLALAMIDLNRFKIINDKLGHLWGDALLKQVGLTLSESTRHADIIARFGGDEFIYLFTKIDDPESIRSSLERKLKHLQKPTLIALNNESHELTVGACAGVAFFPADGNNSEELILAADEAMYRAKHLPDASVVFSSDPPNAE